METKEYINVYMKGEKIEELARMCVESQDGILTDYKTFENDLRESNIELKEVLGWEFENFGIDTKYVYGYQDCCLNPIYIGFDTYADYIKKCKEILLDNYTLEELKNANDFEGMTTHDLIQSAKEISHGETWAGIRKDYEIEFDTKDISEFEQINNKPSAKYILMTCANTENGHFYCYDNLDEFRKALIEELKSWY